MFTRRSIAIIPLLFIYWVCAAASCLAGEGSDDQARKLSESYALDKATGTLYYSEIRADSTVLLREGDGRGEGAASLVMPATTLRAIYERVDRRLFEGSGSRQHFAVGLEQGALEMSFLRRMDLLLLGGLGLLLTVLLGVTAWLWLRLRRERTRRQMLRIRHRAQVEGQEQERRRLAQELHDGPVQALHGVHMHLAAASFSSGDGAPRESPMGTELMRIARNLRAMSASLHPATLEQFGLAAALREHAARLEDRHANLQFELELPRGELPLGDSERLAFYRIGQEAMTNAAVHAGGERVAVKLEVDDPHLRLCISDRGKGFRPDDDHPERYGLLGMQERADAVGADLQIQSAPGRGTTVTATLVLRGAPV